MRLRVLLIIILLLFSLLPFSAGIKAGESVLRGFVKDGFGKGIKDALVSACNYLSGEEYTATTDANGFFQFTNLEPEMLYFIRVSAYGFYHHSKHDCMPGNTYEFVLQPSASIVGKIYSQDGGAIVNATLRLSNPKFGVEVYAISDESGGFNFTSSNFEVQIYPGDGYEIWASAKGHISNILARNVSLKAGETLWLNLSLQRSACITGFVKGINGEAVENAKVYAFKPDGVIASTDLTDASGRYCLDTDLTFGNYTLQVFPSSLSEQSWLNSEPLAINLSSPWLSVDFTLKPAGIVKGKVLSAEGVLPNAIVSVSNENGTCASATTDNNGTFSISSPRLTSGSYRIRAECRHHLSREETITITEGSTTWIELNLSKSRSVAGYLRTTSGQGIFGSVEIFSGERSIEKIYTTQDGYYILDTDLDSGIYRIEAMAPGFIKVSRSVDLSTAMSVENFNFTLSEAGKAVVNLSCGTQALSTAIGYLIQKEAGEWRILESAIANNGTLIFGNGWQNLAQGYYSLLIRNAPGCEEKFLENFVWIEDGKTTFYSLNLNKSAEFFGHVYYKKELLADVKIEFWLSNVEIPFQTPAIALSDSEGYFHIMTALSGGIYSVRAQHAIYGSVSQEVSVESGGRLEVNIYFARSSGMGGVLGVVVESGGDALKGVSVAIYNGTKKLKSCVTNESGYFLISEIPEGTYTLVFEKEGYARVERSVSILSDENTDIGIVELEKLPPQLGNITGYVVDEQGKPIPGASICLEGREISVISNSIGEFRITGLEEGEYILLVSAPGYKDVRRALTVTPGNTTTVWIEMEKEVEVKTTPGFGLLGIFVILPAALIIWRKFFIRQ